MAIKLNLVKARVISSVEELATFKKEATAALLKFAETNVCNLEAVSDTLQSRYAEIAKELSEGNQVETAVDIFPQEPGTVKQACMQKLAVHPGADEANPGLKPEGYHAGPLAVDPEATDPLDLMIAQQEATPEAAPAGDPAAQSEAISMEDIAALLASNPEGQKAAGEVMAAEPALGRTTTWNLVTRIARGVFTKSELRQLRAALRVVAGDEDRLAKAIEGEDANIEAEQAGEDIPHSPRDVERATELFSDPGSLKAAQDLVEQFNDLIADIDEDLMPPVTLPEIIRHFDQEQRSERESIEMGNENITPMSPKDIYRSEPSKEQLDKRRMQRGEEEAKASKGQQPVTPAFNSLDPAERDAALEGADEAAEASPIWQWYTSVGIDMIQDLTSGVAKHLEETKVTDMDVTEVVNWMLSESNAKDVPTYADVDRVVGEIRHERKSTEDRQKAKLSEDAEAVAAKEKADAAKAKAPAEAGK